MQSFNFGGGLIGKFVEDYLCEGNFLFEESSRTFVFLQFKMGRAIYGIQLDMFELGHLVDLIKYSLELREDGQSVVGWCLENEGSFGPFDIKFVENGCTVTRHSQSIRMDINQCNNFLLAMSNH